MAELIALAMLVVALLCWAIGLISGIRDRAITAEEFGWPTSAVVWFLVLVPIYTAYLGAAAAMEAYEDYKSPPGP